ncbi:hypothetical protein M427DRAFT_497018 [Gonapodya prolifera JEL478]|uniref:Uncharacterized protein n=1 Tax=Gonapodya prolifera (strain JEL478) TaxID=1344416 RepID=A0A139AH51_GONPJ|nr:hypothetical protein M427DRAFT_497018 [Gonapodya prolifera JEL478]|eukprot:KXS15743.1 hypothetical protein M427DRAFT_497018 [Gonapodya prolifera JEL478]
MYADFEPGQVSANPDTILACLDAILAGAPPFFPSISLSTLITELTNAGIAPPISVTSRLHVTYPFPNDRAYVAQTCVRGALCPSTSVYGPNREDVEREALTKAFMSCIKAKGFSWNERVKVEAYPLGRAKTIELVKEHGKKGEADGGGGGVARAGEEGSVVDNWKHRGG